MLDFEVPRIVRDLDLGDYAEEMRGTVIPVWVNPPHDMELLFSNIQDEIKELLDKIQSNTDQFADVENAKIIQAKIERANLKLFEWYAEIWSQREGYVETAETVRDFAIKTQKTDPALWRYVAQKTWLMIQEHKTGALKN